MPIYYYAKQLGRVYVIKTSYTNCLESRVQSCGQREQIVILRLPRKITKVRNCMCTSAYSTYIHVE